MSSMLPGEGRVVKRCETAKRNGSEGNEHRTTLGESRNSASESEGGLESTSWRHSKSRMPQQTCMCNICMHFFLLVFFSMFLCIFHFHFPLVFQFPAPWHGMPGLSARNSRGRRSSRGEKEAVPRAKRRSLPNSFQKKSKQHIQMIQIQILSVSDTLAIESYPLDSRSSHTTSVIDMLR